MSKFMVAGFIQMETIVKVNELPLPYKQFCSEEGIIDLNIGGAGYNEAVALRWLGNDVDFMSMVAKEFALEKYNNVLNPAQLDLDMRFVLPVLDGMPHAIILYANGQTQTFEDVKCIRHTPYDYALFEKQIQDKDMVLISSCNFCRPLLELAKKYNKPLAVNVRSMRKEKVLEKADFIREADILYVSEDDLDGTPYECLEQCKEIGNPKIVIIGLGDKGVLMYTKEQNSVLEYKPVKTNEVVNTIGAGNAMFSAFLHYYVKTGDEREAIKNALLFASYKIGFVGTSIGFMTEEQIEQWKPLIWK